MAAAHLRLVQTNDPIRVEDGEPVAFDLEVQATRPGLAYEGVQVELSHIRLRDAAAAAAQEGWPLEAWLALTIESERAVRAVARTAQSRHALVKVLDRSAESSPDRAIGPRTRTRLAAYAEAVRGARAKSPQTRLVETGDELARVTLPVPHHTATAWQLAAQEVGEPISAWAGELLEGIPGGRPLWDAAAAESGQMLAEWVGVQAARSPR